MKKLTVSILISITLCLVFGDYFAFAADCGAIREKTLRLHILANSNSEADQKVKLLVRDEVLKATNGLFDSADDKAELITAAQANTGLVKSVADRVLAENGFKETAKVSVVNMYFNTRYYDNLTMPAGYYDAVRIEIGKAGGKNWWCVLYPKLCISASVDKNSLDDYSDSEKKIVTKKDYKFKFALLELFGKKDRNK